MISTPLYFLRFVWLLESPRFRLFSPLAVCMLIKTFNAFLLSSFLLSSIFPQIFVYWPAKVILLCPMESISRIPGWWSPESLWMLTMQQCCMVTYTMAAWCRHLVLFWRSCCFLSNVLPAKQYSLKYQCYQITSNRKNHKDINIVFPPKTK